jgi:hypothetical protein
MKHGDALKLGKVFKSYLADFNTVIVSVKQGKINQNKGFDLFAKKLKETTRSCGYSLCIEAAPACYRSIKKELNTGKTITGDEKVMALRLLDIFKQHIMDTYGIDVEPFEGIMMSAVNEQALGTVPAMENAQ